jgi:energy-coupling factor transport system permease protein
VGELPHRGRKRKKTGIEFFRNVSFGRFLDRPSVLRKLSAGWKLGLLFFLAAAAIAGPPPFFPLGVLVFTLLSGRFLGRTGPAHLLRGLVPIAPWIVVIMVLQLFFTSPSDTGRVLFSRYFIQITVDELFRILAILFRVSSLMAMLSLYSAVTPLRETMGAINSFLSVFGRFGFPSRDVSLAAGIALRFVPVLTEEAERIVTAQLSRGGKKKRLGMILSMMAPLFLRALERSEALAKAMMLRLYRRGPLYP